MTALSARASRGVTRALSIELRLTLVLADIDLPAGAVRPNTTWGHPEAAVIWRAPDAAAGVLLARLGLALPIGAGDDAALGRRPFDNQSQLLASALRGWRDRELFAAGRVAVTPSARLTVGPGRCQGFGEIKVPLMLAPSHGQEDPRIAVKPLAISAALGAGAAVSLLGRLSVGVAPWAVVDVVPAAAIRDQGQTRWALSLVPEARVRITEHVSAALGSTIFLAGAVHGLPSFAIGVTGS